ncbi:MAG: hypothetical protein ACAI38_06590 [Myxococcota bacterium]|nr:hypothetical protein [Myxococcota bacterium]
MKRYVVAALLLLGACRHGNPEKMSIKAARTSRFAEPWGAAKTEPAPEAAPAPPTEP